MSIEQDLQKLKKKIDKEKGILSTLKANKFRLIKKTIRNKEQQVENLQAQYDWLFRMRQRGHQ